MSKERANIKQVRRNRWERQRRTAIKQEQIERSYKQHTPPQIASEGVSRSEDVQNESCANCGRICAIGSACVWCVKHGDA